MGNHITCQETMSVEMFSGISDPHGSVSGLTGRGCRSFSIFNTLYRLLVERLYRSVKVRADDFES
jgi:hypothetical protein